jgi:hypothetical protein
LISRFQLGATFPQGTANQYQELAHLAGVITVNHLYLRDMEHTWLYGESPLLSRATQSLTVLTEIISEKMIGEIPEVSLLVVADLGWEKPLPIIHGEFPSPSRDPSSSNGSPKTSPQAEHLVLAEFGLCYCIPAPTIFLLTLKRLLRSWCQAESSHAAVASMFVCAQHFP